MSAIKDNWDDESADEEETETMEYDEAQFVDEAGVKAKAEQEQEEEVVGGDPLEEEGVVGGFPLEEEPGVVGGDPLSDYDDDDDYDDELDNYDKKLGRYVAFR
jgi:hypothetical protein